jgi:phytol kinase
LNPLLGILGVLAAFGASFLGLRLLEKTVSPHPEVLRKMMHVTMGLVAVSFPWVFDQAWPVLLLAGGSIAALVLVRSDVAATRSMRGILYGVERTSWGELLFPVSVALVFVLSGGDPLLYCVPILILTLADGVAALIGLRYGQTPFKTLDGSKSIEGSLAFFVVTFLCIHVALLLFSSTGRAESLLISLLMGVIVMMFEAVAWRGLDNLFVPVASFALLETYIDLDVFALSVRLVIILLLGLALLYSRRHSNLDDSALIGAGLVAYGAWAIGDFYWLLVPVSVFVIATWFMRHRAIESHGQIHNVYALLGIAGPGFGWLILQRTVESVEVFFAYTVAFATHLTIIGASHAQAWRPSWLRIVPGVLQGLVVLFLPFMLMWGLDDRLLPIAVIGTGALVLAGFAYLRLQPALAGAFNSAERWRRQALIAGGLSVIAWVLIHEFHKAGLQG